ncbi:MAG: RAD55 family ATPase [Candidatus Thermoplasmatota archaeon]|nr:RAD55 family ATPase [Candidatus Thermoplasmatota archaeon]
MELTTTGISGLDAQIGGFPRGSTILFLSEPCNATYIFAEQFASGGILKNEKVVYYSLERPTREIVDGIAGLESIGPEKAKSVECVDGYSAIMEPENKKQAKSQSRAQDALDFLSSAKMKGPCRLALESLSSIMMNGSESDAIALLQKIVFLTRRSGGVSLVMMTKGMHSTQFEYTAKHIVDGVLEIGIERRGFGIYPFIMITKMRGVIESTKMLLYKETERGLWLESTRRVF